RERSDLIKYQGEGILRDLLDVVDNLELALQHTEADPQKLKDGVALIHKMFLEILGRWEVRADTGMGKGFDPSKHSAISRVPTDHMPAGTIVNELKKAYFYKDKLLRPGEVVVSAEREEQESEREAGEEESMGEES